MNIELGQIPALTQGLLGHKIPEGSIALFAHQGEDTTVAAFSHQPSIQDLIKFTRESGPVYIQGYGIEGATKLWALQAELDELDNQIMRKAREAGEPVPAPAVEIAGSMVIEADSWRSIHDTRFHPIQALTPQLQRLVGTAPVHTPQEILARLVLTADTEIPDDHTINASGDLAAHILNVYSPQGAATFTRYLFQGHAAQRPLNESERQFFDRHPGSTRQALITQLAANHVCGWGLVDQCLSDQTMTAPLVDLARTAHPQVAGHMRTYAGHVLWLNGHDGLASVPTAVVANYIQPYIAHQPAADALYRLALQGAAPTTQRDLTHHEINTMLNQQPETSMATHGQSLGVLPSAEPPSPQL